MACTSGNLAERAFCRLMRWNRIITGHATRAINDESAVAIEAVIL